MSPLQLLSHFRRGAIALVMVVQISLILAPAATAQTVSGIINNYYEVLAINTCTITLNFTGGLNAGDRILIIQMQGATIEESESEAHYSDYAGNGYSTSGLWEFNAVTGVAGNKISLREEVFNVFIPGPGRVQVVRIPSYSDVTVSGPLNAIPWDGRVGGVVALEASGTITLEDNVDASGAGFMGGTASPGGNAEQCGIMTMKASPTEAGQKGTGIANLAGSLYGRGAPANGGGGGANHNAGGGGGANGGNGGRGGAQYQGTQCATMVSNGGLGGNGLGLYFSPGPRAYMGGGGGSGHINNGGLSVGGRGGGIVILAGGLIKGNGHSIISDGMAANPVADDGAGGGGAGGVVVLACTGVIGPMNVSVQGGRGGDANSSELIGPGGGGGGGVIMSPPSAQAFTFNLAGGDPGIVSAFGDPHDAAKGRDGRIFTGPGPNVPEGKYATSIGLHITPSGPLSFCKGGSVTLDAGSGFRGYEWIDPANGRSASQSIVASAPGNYQVTVRTSGGCEGVDHVTVTVWDPPTAVAGPDIPPCESKKFIGFEATGGASPYSYSWSPATGLNDPHVSRPLATPTGTTTYTVTVTDANGCTATDQVVVNVVPPMKVDMPSEVETCLGTPIQIGSIATGGTPGYGYQWKPATGLDNATYARPLANPDKTTTYYLRLNDVNGCIYLDTITVRVKPLPVISAGQDLLLCRGNSIPLTVTSGASYKWTPATGLTCTDCRSPIASPGTTTQYIVTVTDSAGCSASDTVIVAVRTPKITGGTTTIDFGSLVGCTTSAEKDFVIRNDDSNDINIDQAAFSNAGFAVISPSFPIPIRAHDSAILRLRFTPVAGGTTTGTMTLKALCNTEYTVDLSGIKPTTAIASEPAVVNFGSSLTCGNTTIDTTITISNTGTAPLTVGREVVAPPYSLPGSTLPRTIPPGDTIHLVIRYAPAAAGVFNTDLALPFQAGACSDTLRVSMNGTRYQPQASINLASIDFPSLLGCDYRRDTTITVVNRGQVPVTIESGIGASGFRLVTATPTGAVAPGDSISLPLSFIPTTQGNSSTRFALVYGPCHDTLHLALTGNKQGISFQLPDTIDFGDLLTCAGSSFTRKLTITNTSDGSVAGVVKESSITGEFSSTLADGAPLPNGQPQSFDVTFNPTGDGVTTGSLDIALDPCGITRSIILTGRRLTPALTAVAPLNLGPVSVGKNASGDLHFRNSGTSPITIDRIDGIAAPLALVGTQPALPVVLQPGEELIVTIRFDATVGQLQRTITAVTTIPCVISADGSISAEGISLGGATTVSIPPVMAAPGDIVTIPLMITSSTNVPAGSISSYRATLRFNRTLLIPVTPPLSDAIVGTDRVVTYAGQSGGPAAQGTFASILFRAALGDTLTTPIFLDSFLWNDQSIAVTKGDGFFTLSDICLTGGQRLINAEGNLTLKPVHPNPAGATADIEYEVVENGRTQLYLSDLLGRRIATLVDSELTPGGYVVRLDTHGMETGTYFYTLQTPTGRLTRMMQIRK